MNIFIKISLFTLILAIMTLLSCNNDDDSTPTPLETFKASIIGSWESVGSEFDANANNYGYRTLTLTADTWSIKVERFADEARTTPLFTLEFEGPYEITGESSVLLGSYNGTFSFTKKYITSFIDPTMLGLGDCGLTMNTKADVTDIDCAWLESVEHCPADYDLITLENVQLIAGERTANMCEESGRPTQKGFPMNRQ